MIASSVQTIAASTAVDHNSADGTSNKEGFFVVLSGSGTLPVATLAASATTQPDGVIVTGYPANTLPDDVALPGFGGIVKVAIDTTQSGAIAIGAKLYLVAGGAVCTTNPGTGQTYYVAKALQALSAADLAIAANQVINARLVEPILSL